MYQPSKYTWLLTLSASLSNLSTFFPAIAQIHLLIRQRNSFSLSFVQFHLYFYFYSTQKKKGSHCVQSQNPLCWYSNHCCISSVLLTMAMANNGVVLCGKMPLRRWISAVPQNSREGNQIELFSCIVFVCRSNSSLLEEEVILVSVKVIIVVIHNLRVKQSYPKYWLKFMLDQESTVFPSLSQFTVLTVHTYLAADTPCNKIAVL